MTNAEIFGVFHWKRSPKESYPPMKNGFKQNNNGIDIQKNGVEKNDEIVHEYNWKEESDRLHKAW